MKNWLRTCPAPICRVYLAAGYFRIGNDRYFVPISLVVPGSADSLRPQRDSATKRRSISSARSLDSSKRAVGDMRDTVKLAVEHSDAVKQKNVQYDSGFILPAGKYHLKIRRARKPRPAAWDRLKPTSRFPIFKIRRMKMSSVVLASQIQTAGKHENSNDPLVRDGSEIVPNVTHVFTSGQHLYLYYEVYDPAPRAPRTAKPKLRMAASGFSPTWIFSRAT